MIIVEKQEEDAYAFPTKRTFNDQAETKSANIFGSKQMLSSVRDASGSSRRLVICFHLSASECVPLHRDFYFDQVLVSKEHVYLLDLDLAAMGPAELDVGNYLAHLDEYGIRHPSEEANCQELAEAFLGGYMVRSPSVCTQAVAIWRHLSLARHIAISAQIAGRAHTTLPLLKKICSTTSVIESTLMATELLSRQR